MSKEPKMSDSIWSRAQVGLGTKKNWLAVRQP